jgi:hypothetical protein
MSDENISLWTSLKNRVQYEVRNAIDSPEANKRAVELKKKEEIKKSEHFQNDNKQKQEGSEKKTDEQKDTTDKSGDPNKFSITRLFSKTWTHLSNNIATYAVPFVALMLSMLVANEAIIYTPPVRILFFVATFVICVMFNAYLAFLAFFYIIKAGYSYYVNNMTDGPKRNIFPTIFAILPITTYEPSGAFTSVLLSPFRYPKSEEKQAKLPELMKDYWNLLLASFPGLDKVKNQPTIAKGLKNIEEQFAHLHDVKTSVLDLNVTKNKPETNGV